METQALKTKRSLSGIYVKFDNPETKQTENRCFEDLPENEQNIFMNSLDNAGIERMMESMSKTLKFVMEANGYEPTESEYEQGMTRDYYEINIKLFTTLIHLYAARNDMKHESEIPENERINFKPLE